MEGLEYLSFGLLAIPIAIGVYGHYVQKRQTKEIVSQIKSRGKIIYIGNLERRAVGELK